MSELFHTGIVRIEAGSVGTGFLLLNPPGTYYIVTCAHVLGLPIPQTAVVSFYPFGETREVRIDAPYWNERYDVAIFRFSDPLPAETRPLYLGSSRNVTRGSICTFGFPAFEDYVNGRWGHGDLDGEIPSLSLGCPMLQISSTQITRGFSGSAVWHVQRKKVLGMITALQDKDEYGKGEDIVYALPSEMLREVYPKLKIQDVCPYRGLEPFKEEDATYFFGREHYIEELLSRLQDEKRFLALLGPVGSGKTSVVHAGLVPQLRHGKLLRSERWAIKSHPIPQDPHDPYVLMRLFQVEGPLILQVKQWREQHPEHERLVLVLDQFEHIFSENYDSLRQLFFAQLVSLLESNLATVILVMRDNYYNVIAEHMDLMRWVERCLSNIPALTEEQLLSVVQRPADLEGLVFEDGLASYIAQEATRSRTEPAAIRRNRHSAILSSMSFFLKELWEKRDDNVLGWETYKNLHGVFGRLPEVANTAYYELNEHQQRLARRIFTNLVSLGDEQTGHLDRRIQRSLTQLCRFEKEQAEVRQVVEKFAAAGLLEISFEESRQDIFVQLIHEILFWEWDLFRDWLREDRQFLHWYHGLLGRAQQWMESSPFLVERRDQDLLLRGQDLKKAALWLEERAIDMHLDAQHFIRESLTSFEREEQRRKQAEESKQRQHIALARQLATQAQILEIQQPHLMELSLLLAVEAMRRYPCLEADQAIRRGLKLLPTLLLRLDCRGSVRKILFGADSSTLVVANENRLLWTHALSEQSYFKPYPLAKATSLALSDNGYYLLAAGEGRCAWLLDTIHEKPLLKCSHHGQITAVALSPTFPYWAATASEDTTVGIWDLSQIFSGDQRTIQEAQRLHSLGHGGPVYDLALSPNGQYLATTCADHLVRVWHVPSGDLLDLVELSRSIHLIAFSPDGTAIALADGAQSAFVWRWQHEGRKRRWLKKKHTSILQLYHQKKIQALVFSPDGRKLLTASDDATARLWNVNTENEIYEAQRFEHKEPIKAACFHPSGSYIATASDDYTARIWEIESGQVVHCLPHDGPVSHVAFHPMKPYIITGSHDGTLAVWKTERSSLMMCFAHEGTVKDLFFGVRNGKHFLRTALEEKDQLRFWELTEGNEMATLLFQNTSSSRIIFSVDKSRYAFYNSIAIFSPDGHYLAYCDAGSQEEGSVTIRDAIHGRDIVKLSQGERVYALQFSADGCYLAIAHQGNAVSIWDWKEVKRKPLLRLPHPASVHSVVFMPDATSLITLCEDCIVRIWKWRESDEPHCYFLRHQDRVTQAILSPNGQYLVTVSQDHGARVWDSTTGALISYKVHQKAVLAATFSPDNNFIATVSSDNTARIWKTTEDHQLVSLKHEGQVYACAFSLDGKYLATASDDHRVCIWIWRPEDLILEANRHLTRNLTEEEWKRFIGNEPYRRTCLYLGWREKPLKYPFSLED